MNLKLIKKKWNIIKNYFRSGVFFRTLFLVLINGFKKKSLEVTYLSIENIILCKLRKKNKKFINNFTKEKNDIQNSNIIWICWFQGIDNAPDLVKKCYNSLIKYKSDREVIVINENNYTKYTNLPDYILDKYNKGIISRTHFSDILRLELLTLHGGVWVDATVFFTNYIPEYVFKNELFFFQIFKPGLLGHPTRVSSWFIASNPENDILELTKALLWKYWKTKKHLCTYFLLHDFIELSIEKYPKKYNNIIPVSNSGPHLLQYNLDHNYNEDLFDIIKNTTPIHKLTYKFNDERINGMKNENSFYSVLFKEE